jgi:hypothetical protein
MVLVGGWLLVGWYYYYFKYLFHTHNISQFQIN